MKKTNCVVCIAIALTLVSIGTFALAEKTNSINYAVRAILPENQINDQVSYFDLKVVPGQEQVLQVTIKNKGDEDIEVALEANTAFSNSNGLIEFTHTDDRDDSMAVDFAQIVTPVEPVITVPAHSEVVVEFQLSMPEEPFGGIVYGGFMFTKLHQGEDAEGEAGVSIRNIYRYVIGVRLRMSEATIEPAFELVGVEMDQTGKPVLLMHLRNPQSIIARGMGLRVYVYPQDDHEAVFTYEKDNVAMAPNSSMQYTINLSSKKVLKAGVYRVSVELEFEDHIWRFETTLTVD